MVVSKSYGSSSSPHFAQSPRAGGKAGIQLISHRVFLKSFCRSQLPHKFVDVSSAITDMENNMTDFCGNGLSQNDFENTLCEIKKAGIQAERTRRRAWMTMTEMMEYLRIFLVSREYSSASSAMSANAPRVSALQRMKKAREGLLGAGFQWCRVYGEEMCGWLKLSG